YSARVGREGERLYAPHNRIPNVGNKTRTAVNPRTLEPIIVGVRIPKNGMLFTYKTRHYLQRRAWRYFRRVGFQKPEKFVPAVADALRRYVDDDLKLGENLLDSWSLMHGCFFESDVITFDPYYAKLKED